MLVDRAGLSEARRAELERAVARHDTLAEVIRWGVAQKPPCVVVDVVVQDEFTHDVILPYRDGLHLVYDTT
ncbi:hypothetical protein [Haliangium sp.]|uniref:hypothetical protein n=1 Tax=Haliangium sp. TaxID=2663208 RepID=UPI003D0B975D